MCAKGRVVTITGTEARDFLSKIESHVRSSEAKHPADLRRPQEVCNCSIQENGSSALKPLGVRYRTASGSDRIIFRLKFDIFHLSSGDSH